MIAMLSLALQAVPLPTLAPIGRQQLPAHGCAAYLWNASEGAKPQGIVAMATADPAQLRLTLDGKTIDLPRIAQHGSDTFGLGDTASYRAGEVDATLTLVVSTRADLRDGAAIPQATLNVARDHGDALVVPLAGLIGCRSPG